MTSALFKVPKSLSFLTFFFFHYAGCDGYMGICHDFFHQVRKRWLHVWNFTTLGDYVYEDSGVSEMRLSPLVDLVRDLAWVR